MEIEREVRETDRAARPRAATAPIVALLAALLVLPSFALPAAAASLNPSRSALMRQVRAAQAHGAYYAANDYDLRTMLQTGELVRIPGDRNYVLKSSIRHPYARPEVELFLERMGSQYRAACGQRLVVTSLVRPKDRQPRNSSPFSVHPTGMAVDLRQSSNRTCRRWLERVLTSLEDRGLVEAARERYPPHYHVVLFPDPYLEYVEATLGEQAVADYRPQTTFAAGEVVDYRVRRGDSLWLIAQRFDTTVAALRQANALASNYIRAGQELKVPAGARGAVTTSYRVRRGDSLWTIAHRFGTTTLAIQQANGLASTALRPGQELEIPSGDGGGVRSATYRVQSGDSLWKIARRHGTSTREIQRANGLRGSRIKPGQVLRIPEGR